MPTSHTNSKAGREEKIRKTKTRVLHSLESGDMVRSSCVDGEYQTRRNKGSSKPKMILLGNPYILLDPPKKFSNFI